MIEGLDGYELSKLSQIKTAYLNGEHGPLRTRHPEEVARENYSGTFYDTGRTIIGVMQEMSHNAIDIFSLNPVNPFNCLKPYIDASVDLFAESAKTSLTMVEFVQKRMNIFNQM